ncbi:MAG TPA: M28 family peptidase [Acidobacteriaceae bacterium]|jgi:Zn-dependent M28 family amino/carboxypeptidase|nr:M28 family peptidase [Acidobacteriaceae bacterium]
MTRPRTIESVILPRSKAKGKDLRIFLLLALTLTCSPQAPAQKSAVSGESVYSLTQQFLAVAPKRYNGSPGHLAAEQFISDHFKPEAAKANLEKDEFTVNTPAGPQTMRNYIVRYPGKRDGIIVLASHYETNYPLRNIHFVGANDGACTSALLIAIGQYLRVHPPTGYSVWLLFDDGEEAVQDWNYSAYTDHTYGTRHLAAKWYSDGTDRRIKAFIVADMIGDKDLNIDRVTNSSPWLLDALRTAAKNTGHSANIFRYSEDEQDDHEPFAQRGVPVIDLIDAHYGPSTVEMPDGYHHTADDTIDKISPQSLQISADIILELIRLINQR